MRGTERAKKEKMSEWYERNKEKVKEKYVKQKTIAHSTSDARSRFMKFKEETKDGKIRSLKPDTFLRTKGLVLMISISFRT